MTHAPMYSGLNLLISGEKEVSLK